MFSIRTLLLQHGYLVLYSYIFMVQAGVPVPSDPLLLIMGALSGDGLYSLPFAMVLAVLAAVSGDFIWFELGRLKGRSILGLLCKFSLEPDTCINKTENSFTKRGSSALLFAKFIPGMGIVAMPLSGMTGMSHLRFLIFDTAGSILWASAYLSIGFLFHRQVNQVIVLLGLFGRRAGLVVTLLIGGYLLYKYIQRQRLLRQLRINKITSQELYALVAAGDAPVILDLRNGAEVEEDGWKLKGAIVMRTDEIRERAQELPRGQDIVLYCSCPNETTSARVALQLKREGIIHVRPLQGGIEEWRALGLPMDPVVHTEPQPLAVDPLIKSIASASVSG